MINRVCSEIVDGHSITQIICPQIISALCATLVGVVLAVPRVEAQTEVTRPQSPPRLGLPLLCKIGATCWVANYVDVDTSRGVRDFRCRRRSYDGHDGVDFALRDLNTMAQGVPVIASAAGRVKNIRDNMQDVAISDQASRARIEGRECGNGVLIDHSGGWQTQYCHLRRNSVRVKPGQQIAAGTPIGLVGLSGQTEFPHLHISARYNGEAMDPFTGQPVKAGCGKMGQPLWRSDLDLGYETVALYNAGFAAGKPDLAAIRNDALSAKPFPVDAPALVLWVDMFGVEAGDRVKFRITQPDGQPIFAGEQQIEKTQARRFAYGGIRRTQVTWPAGTYTGEVTHTRVGKGQPTTTTIVTRAGVN